MCGQLLTNPNIEDYTFEIEPNEGGRAMKWGVVRFPGSLDDADALWALNEVMGQEARALWHKDEDLADVQCVVLPGGFSYGDYLRCGAIARFSPIMKSVVRFAGDGGLVLGICNGFQILCEAHLLPGALMRNRSLAFICERVNMRVENAATPFTCAARQGEVLRLPIKHGEGSTWRPPRNCARWKSAGRCCCATPTPRATSATTQIRTARPGRSLASLMRPSMSSA